MPLSRPTGTTSHISTKLNFYNHQEPTHSLTMRWLLSYLLFALLGFVQSTSDYGHRILAVIEDIAKQDNYSELWADLEGAVKFG